MICGDKKIRFMVESGELTIEPLGNDTIRENGCDLSIGNEYWVLNKHVPKNKALNVNDGMKDTSIYYNKNTAKDGKILIEKNKRYLLTTIEYIEMPKNVMGFCNLRSTLARYGIIIPPTIVDANFKGQLTIELIGSSFDIEIPVGFRFLHIIFAETTEVEKLYNGKFQGQKGITVK